METLRGAATNRTAAMLSSSMQRSSKKLRDSKQLVVVDSQHQGSRSEALPEGTKNSCTPR
ncbi:hypothetical protein ZHAS_00013659 [Anopheles sinensis]|uniref:Uncharacterized protein n=1 Tax=Anopheles sinensis TaxID=74873 RepID=A0A084W666_ANOSI|nr:hypothetical protein ZHAS_00013659 [Anopheles sinensis]